MHIFSKNTFLMTILFAFSSCLNAKLYVELQSQPTSPNAMFYGVIVGGDENDPDPNPCYKIYNCSLRGYVNSESWGEAGSAGYQTKDNQSLREWDKASQDAATLGEFIKSVRASGTLRRTMKDYLPASAGQDPIFCIYAAQWRPSVYDQIANTRASNCARALPFPAVCQVKEIEVNYDFGKIIPQNTHGSTKTNSFSISCTKKTAVKIKIGEGGVVLNGYTNKRVNFSFDSGPFNNEWVGEIGDEKRMPLTAKLPDLEEGDWSGSAILMVTLE